MASSERSERPNLLVIMADEHAPQFSGFAGHPIVQTPHLDRLAAEGILFQNAYCNSPLCVPSRMSFMAGRYVHHVGPGAYDNGSSLPSDTVTWAHLVRASGYDAVLSGKQHFVGLDQLHGFIAPLFPLIVPQRFWDMYPPEDVDLPTIPAGHLDGQHPVYQRMRRMFGMAEFPEEATRRGRAAYYGLITYLDEKMGRLLDALEETGQRQNTLVVYTADHGEMAGEHGMWRKSNFYEHSARVPLIMSWPAGLPRGRRAPHAVSTVDTVATMVASVGAQPVAPLDGTSLLPLARGEAGAAESWPDE